jgi:hypothetical protein
MCIGALMFNIFNTLLYIYALVDGCLLFTASLLCDWFYILWLQPCKDVLERVNKYNTIQTVVTAVTKTSTDNNTVSCTIFLTL